MISFLNTMVSLPSRSKNTSVAPKFAGLDNGRQPAAWLEERLNAMHPATDQFIRYEAKKEKLDEKLDRLLGKFKGRQAKKALRDADNNLMAAVKESGFSKSGGLSSAYWQAFHLPEALFVSALGDTQPGKDDFIRYAKFVQETYLPLVKTLDGDKDWWTVDWLLKGMQDGFGPENANDNFARMQSITQTLLTLKQNDSPFWTALQVSVDAAHSQLNEAFYHASTVEFFLPDASVPRSAAPNRSYGMPLPKAREAAYLAERRQMVSDVLLPWLSVIDVFSGDENSDVLHNFSEQLLPETLGRFAQTHEPPRLIFTDDNGPHGEPETFKNMRRETLQLLLRATSLHADLNQVPCNFTPMRTALEKLQPEEQTPEIREGAAPIYITHDDVLNVLPEEFKP